MKLLLVDPSSIFRMGMKAALAAAPKVGDAGDLEVVGECDDGATACALAVALGPDVVVADLHLGDRNGIALARQLGRTAPAVRVLILASHGPEAIVHQAFGAGAVGYACKGQSPTEIIAAIRSVGRGDLVLPPGVAAPPPRVVGARAEKNAGTTHAIERLSQRERQIFDLVIWGSSNKQIAGRLGISIKTVETHRGHINGKLRVHTSADIVRLASLWGLLSGGADPGGRKQQQRNAAAVDGLLVAAAAHPAADLLGQRLAGDAEVLGGERAVAAADLQHAADVAELDLLERRDGRRRRVAGGLDDRWRGQRRRHAARRAGAPAAARRRRAAARRARSRRAARARCRASGSARGGRAVSGAMPWKRRPNSRDDSAEEVLGQRRARRRSARAAAAGAR